MTPERWEKIREIFERAVESSDRNAIIAEACRDDEDLRREVESLLAQHSESVDSLLDPRTSQVSEVAVLESKEFVPRQIGHYRILGLLGKGGMGTVYKAEQEHPRRIVALKVVHPGWTSPELLRRFELESQALGRLQHPCIAQIYEAGTADALLGVQPYFAMEYIQGETLCNWAETSRPSVEERLKIMANICAGVDHAHQRGIIHRDLKPANILVDKAGQPKILDFGVARVTDRDAQASLHTFVGQIVGTLAYMSPEQLLADPLEVDTRSDVYSLGVILFELLAGRKPFDFSGGVHEAARKIREEDPPRLGSISRQCRGDVEAIVAKALEKDKDRRYGSAAAFGIDICHYLAHRPIAARAPGLAYQLRKFSQRHRTLVTGLATGFLLLLGGVAATTWEAVRANRAQQAATLQAATAKAVSDFLQNDVLAQASAWDQAASNVKPDPHLEVRTALDRSATRIAGKFKGQPEVEASIRETIGRTYLDLGLYPEARAQYEGALGIYRRLLGEENPKSLKVISNLAHTAYLEGKVTESEALFKKCAEAQRRVLGAEHPDTLYSMNGLAADYYDQGKYAEAESLFSQNLEIRRRVLGREHPDTLVSMLDLANDYYQQGKYAQAEAIYSQALEIQHRKQGAEDPTTAAFMTGLASVYDWQGKHGQAEALDSQIVEFWQRLLGPEHPYTLAALNNLANTNLEQGKYANAEALLSKTLPIEIRVLGAEHQTTLITMDNLADANVLLGRYARAEALFDRAIEASSRVLGPEHPLTLSILSDLAFLYQLQGKYSLAESLTTQVLARRRHTLGSDDPDTMASAADLALVYLSGGKFAQSEPLAREASEFGRRKQADQWQRFRAESLLGEDIAGEKKYSEAEPLLLEGYQGMLARKDHMGVPDQYHLELARGWLVQLYQAWGKPDKATEWEKK